jgi:hypothetical protein
MSFEIVLRNAHNTSSFVGSMDFVSSSWKSMSGDGNKAWWIIKVYKQNQIQIIVGFPSELPFTKVDDSEGGEVLDGMLIIQ